MAIACRAREAAAGAWPGPAHACLSGFFPLRSWLAGVALSKQEVGAVWRFTGRCKASLWARWKTIFGPSFSC